MVFSAIENLIQGRGSGGLATRGEFDFNRRVRKGCTAKVTSEQRRKEAKEGSPGTHLAEGTASAKALK